MSRYTAIYEKLLGQIECILDDDQALRGSETYSPLSVQDLASLARTVLQLQEVLPDTDPEAATPAAPLPAIPLK